MLQNQASCVICSTALQPGQANTVLCGNAVCDWKFRAIPVSQRCVVCGRALTTEQMARRTCGRAECHREWHVDRPLADHRKRLEARHAAASRFRDRSAADAGTADAASWFVALTPWNSVPSVRKPLGRDRKLELHLHKVVDEAFHLRRARDRGDDISIPVSPHPDPPAADVAAVLLQACIHCRGKCCRAGGEHAFVTPYTILRYLDAHPTQTPAEVVAAYLSFLPTRVLQFGCVYQHPRGCTLPREMRSDTCNRYYCDALRTVIGAIEHDAQPRAFFVPHEGDFFDRGIFSSPTLVKITRHKAESR